MVGNITFLWFCRFWSVAVNIVDKLLFLGASLTIKRNRLLVQTCRQSHVSVCLSVGLSMGKLWKNGWLNLDAVGVVSGVGRGMGVLDGGW